MVIRMSRKGIPPGDPFGMGKNARREYLNAIRPRYKKAGKATKKAILDEFYRVCGYHRKYAIRLLNQVPDRGLLQVQRKNPDQGNATTIP